MANLEKIQKLALKRQKEVEQSSKKFEAYREEKKRKGKKFLTVFIASLALFFLVVVSFAYSYFFMPGPYDGFAKCLAQKGMVVYGADSCQYTQEQRAMFGKSFKYLQYEDFSKGPDIRITPTWVLNGEKYPKVQSFQRLSNLSGCPL